MTTLPSLVVKNQSVNVNNTIQASSLIVSTSDPLGYPITYYRFFDEGDGGAGYFTYNGYAEASGQWITVSAADLPLLQYVGYYPGAETVDAEVWDGYNWSNYQTATITTTVALPQLAVQNQAINTYSYIQASALIQSAIDPNGYAITDYAFRDDGGGAGYFILNGYTQASGSWITVSSFNLWELQYVSGGTAGKEKVEVEAWDGANWSKAQIATITTISQSPVLVAQNQTVGTENDINAASLIKSVSDPSGYAITYYAFRDDGGNGGYFILNGIQQNVGGWIIVSAAQLAQLKYEGGTTAGSETVDVVAWDGYNLSNQKTVTITTQLADLPVITVQNQTLNANSEIQAATLIKAASDPAGNPITYYDFRDDGGGGGYFTFNGIQQTADTWITVSKTDLSALQYIGGAQAGKETVDVAAWNGNNWSYYQTATVTTTANSLPVITVQNQSLDVNKKIQAATLIHSASDPGGHAIGSYEFRDDGGGAGHFTLNGVQQATGAWIKVSAAALSTLQFVAGAKAATETVDIAASNGTNWSNYHTATITADAVVPPTVSLQDQVVGAAGSLAAASFVTGFSDYYNYPISSYKFIDNGGDGGYFTLSGVKQAAKTWISVTAANLANLKYVAGATSGADSIAVEIYDGHAWSASQTAKAIIMSVGGSGLPAVTVQNQSLTVNGEIQASALIKSVSDRTSWPSPNMRSATMAATVAISC